MIETIFKEGILALIFGGLYLDLSHGYVICVVHMLIWLLFFIMPLVISTLFPTSLFAWTFYSGVVMLMIIIVLYITYQLHKEFDKREPVSITTAVYTEFKNSESCENITSGCDNDLLSGLRRSKSPSPHESLDDVEIRSYQFDPQSSGSGVMQPSSNLPSTEQPGKSKTPYTGNHSINDKCHVVAFHHAKQPIPKQHYEPYKDISTDYGTEFRPSNGSTESLQCTAFPFSSDSVSVDKVAISHTSGCRASSQPFTKPLIPDVELRCENRLRHYRGNPKPLQLRKEPLCQNTQRSHPVDVPDEFRKFQAESVVGSNHNYLKRGIIDVPRSRFDASDNEQSQTWIVRSLSLPALDASFGKDPAKNHHSLATAVSANQVRPLDTINSSTSKDMVSLDVTAILPRISLPSTPENARLRTSIFTNTNRRPQELHCRRNLFDAQLTPTSRLHRSLTHTPHLMADVVPCDAYEEAPSNQLRLPCSVTGSGYAIIHRLAWILQTEGGPNSVGDAMRVAPLFRTRSCNAISIGMTKATRKSSHTQELNPRPRARSLEWKLELTSPGKRQNRSSLSTCQFTREPTHRSRQSTSLCRPPTPASTIYRPWATTLSSSRSVNCPIVVRNVGNEAPLNSICSPRSLQQRNSIFEPSAITSIPRPLSCSSVYHLVREPPWISVGPSGPTMENTSNINATGAPAKSNIKISRRTSTTITSGALLSEPAASVDELEYSILEQGFASSGEGLAISFRDIPKKTATTTAAYRVRLFLFWRRRFLIYFDRLQLTALFDRKSTAAEIVMTLALGALVSIFGALLLSSGTFSNFDLTCFCYVLAGCHYSLIKSVQPDPASPRHGFNRVVVYSRSGLFCFLGMVLVILILLIGNDMQGAARDACPVNFFFVGRGYQNKRSWPSMVEGSVNSRSPTIIFYGLSLRPLWLACLLKDVCVCILLVFPVIFLFGLVPQANTILNYLLEQTDIHAFGASGSVDLRSGFFSVVRGLLVIAGGFSFCYQATKKGDPQNVLVSVFWGLYLSMCFMMSRTPNNWGIFRLLWMHITSDVVALSNSAKISPRSSASQRQGGCLCFRRCIQRFVLPLRRLFTTRQLPGENPSVGANRQAVGLSVVNAKQPSVQIPPSQSAPTPPPQHTLRFPISELFVQPARSLTLLTSRDEVCFDEDFSPATSIAGSGRQSLASAVSSNELVHHLTNVQWASSRARRPSSHTATNGSSVVFFPLFENISINDIPPSSVSAQTTQHSIPLQCGATPPNLHDPLPHRVIAAMIVRIRSDFVVLLVWVVLGFAVHVSTVFTVPTLQPFVPRVLIWLGIAWGFILHYVWPQLRMPFPWLLFSQAIIPPAADGVLSAFEVAYHWCHWIERYFLIPAITMATATQALIPLSSKFGEVLATVIILVTTMKLLRHGFSGATRVYLGLFFSEVLFTCDFPGQSETLPVDYFFMSIFVAKVVELWNKLTFVYIYIVPFHVNWGSLCHAIAHIFSIPHIVFVLANCIFSTLISAPLEPFLASVFFITSYARPLRFWETTPNTEPAAVSMSANLRSVSLEQVRVSLNSFFYEHLARCLQQRLAGDLALGRWGGGNVQAGDVYILASEELHFLVHIIEVGNGLVTFQMRGFEFAGTYCHEQERNGLLKPHNLDRGCCCGSIKRLPAALLSPNSAFDLRWVAWQFVHTPYLIDGYRLIDHSAVTSLQVIDFRKIVLTLFIQCLLYFTTRVPNLSNRLAALSDELTQLVVGENKADMDPAFNKCFDDDFDETICGVTRSAFIKVYGRWIRYCLMKCRENKDVNSSDDSPLMSLCYAISLLGRRSLSGASEPPNNAFETFLHYMHDVFKGDVQVAAKDEWVFADVELLNLVVTPALRVALKLYQDHFTWSPLSTSRELFAAIKNTTQSVVICHETDPQWRSSILNDAERLFSFRRLDSGTTQLCYRFIMMNKQILSFQVIKLNNECVRGFWAGQQREQIFLRNRNKERGSIQRANRVLRNLINSSCDPPVGYPIYVSQLLTSFAESHPQYQRVACPNFSIPGALELLRCLQRRIRLYCRQRYPCSDRSDIELQIKSTGYSAYRHSSIHQQLPTRHRQKVRRSGSRASPDIDGASASSSLLRAAGDGELAAWCTEVVAAHTASSRTSSASVMANVKGYRPIQSGSTLSTAVVHHTDSASRRVKIVDPTQILNDHLPKLEWPSQSLLAKCLPQSACPLSSVVGVEGTLVHRWTPSNIDPRRRSFCHRNIALVAFPKGPITLEGHYMAIWEDLGLEFLS